MSTIDEATQIIAEVVGDTMLTDVAAKALADAGLLMPDLPEPDNGDYGTTWGQVFNYQEGPDWRDTKGYVAANVGAVEVVGNDTHIHTPDEARKLAYALLSAANHAEEQLFFKSLDERPLLSPLTVEGEN